MADCGADEQVEREETLPSKSYSARPHCRHRLRTLLATLLGITGGLKPN